MRLAFLSTYFKTERIFVATEQMTNGDPGSAKSVLSAEIDRLREALRFYANSDNYWSAPLCLDVPYDRKTLQAVRSAEKHNKVLVDRGEKARAALGL